MEINGKMIIDLPNKILEISKEYSKQNDLLTKDIIDSYEVKDIRPIIETKINKFKYLKSICSLPIEGSIITNYDTNSNIKSNSTDSKVEKAVIKKIDSAIWLQDFYEAMIRTAFNLTLDEATYIVNALFFHEKEINVAENLSICKQTLQKVKRSSLIKLYHNLETIC